MFNFLLCCVKKVDELIISHSLCRQVGSEDLRNAPNIFQFQLPFQTWVYPMSQFTPSVSRSHPASVCLDLHLLLSTYHILDLMHLSLLVIWAFDFLTPTSVTYVSPLTITALHGQHLHYLPCQWRCHFANMLLTDF